MVPGADDEKPGEIVELTHGKNDEPLYVVRVDGREYRLGESKFKAIESAVNEMSLDDINSDLLPEQ